MHDGRCFYANPAVRGHASRLLRGWNYSPNRPTIGGKKESAFTVSTISLIPLCALQEKLKKVSIFGAGLLVGTALTVIIPEGIRAIYSSCHEEHSGHSGHSHNATGSSEVSHGGNEETMIGLTLILGFIFMLIIDQLTHALQAHSSSSSQTTGHGSAKFFFLKDVFRSSAS